MDCKTFWWSHGWTNSPGKAMTQYWEIVQRPGNQHVTAGSKNCRSCGPLWGQPPPAICHIWTNHRAKWFGLWPIIGGGGFGLTWAIDMRKWLWWHNDTPTITSKTGWLTGGLPQDGWAPGTATVVSLWERLVYTNERTAAFYYLILQNLFCFCCHWGELWWVLKPYPHSLFIPNFLL